MRRTVAVAAVLACVLAPPALAGEYEPGTVPPEASQRPPSSGRVLHVGRGGIQAAIDRARPGDTIRVPGGSYRGPVEIRGASKRGLRLIGQGARVRGTIRVRDTAAIDLRGFDVTGFVILDRVDGYRLERLRVTGGEGAGIDARRSPGGTIVRVLVRADHTGIAVGYSGAIVRAKRTFIREVTVEGGFAGIALAHARAVTVSRARVLDNDVGVSVIAGAGLVLRDNDIRSSGVGVLLSGGAAPLLENNRFLDNVTDVHVIRPPES
jgi:Periplasmic copper-binding protein (NosD)